MKAQWLFGAGIAIVLGSSPFAVSNDTLANLFGFYEPPAQCVAWYDGCNMCDKAVDGSVSCTHRSCATYGKGFCKVKESAPDALALTVALNK